MNGFYFKLKIEIPPKIPHLLRLEMELQFKNGADLPQQVAKRDGKSFQTLAALTAYRKKNF